MEFTDQVAALEPPVVSEACLQWHRERLLGNGIDRRLVTIEHDEVRKRKGLFGGAKTLANPDAEERHAHWAKWAPKLATEAAEKALEKWGGSKDRITHVVVHSCTGFKAPGIELDLVDNLNLANVRRRLGINYMGCFGGFTGMAVAKSFAVSEPDAHVLLVCVEICTAHLTNNEERSKNLGNTIFSDGAAAAIIGPGDVGDWAIGNTMSWTLPKTSRSYMTWEPSNHAYYMHLDKKISEVFGVEFYFKMRKCFHYITGASGMSQVEWCVHPGGRKILDSFCSPKVGLVDERALRHSYGVLRNYGNMSSPTIFFVIDSMIEEAKQTVSQTKSTAFCLGFGPGLTMEMVGLHRIARPEFEVES